MIKYVFVTCLCMVIITHVGCARQTGKTLMADKIRSAGNTYLNDINTRAARDFIKRYGAAVDPDWYKIKDGYIVKFMLNNILHRAAYDNSGEWMYTILYYRESAMLKEVRAIVKRVYYDYRITQVEEIHAPNRPVVYNVHMEDATTWRNVQVCDGEMVTAEVLNKQRR